MANLYEVDYRLETLLEEGFDIETGEILEGVELDKAFDDIAIELDDKIANTIGFIKNLESDAKALKEESDNLKRGLNKHKRKPIG